MLRAVAVSLLSLLTGCDLVFSIGGPDAGSQVDGLAGQRLVRLTGARVLPDLNSGDAFPLPVVDSSPPAWHVGFDADPDGRSVAVRVLDANGSARTIAPVTDGFGFAADAADGVMRLQVRDETGAVTEYRTAAPTIDLAIRAWGRPTADRGENLGGKVSFVPFNGIDTTQFHYIATTGTRTFTSIGSGANIEMDWSNANALTSRAGQLSVAAGDRLYYLGFNNPSDGAGPLQTVAAFQLNLGDGTNAPPQQLTSATLSARSVVVLDQATAFAARIDEVAVTEQGWGFPHHYTQLRSLARPEVGLVASLPIALWQTTAAAPAHGTVTLEEVAVFPGEQTYALSAAYRQRSYLIDTVTYTAFAAYQVLVPVAESAADATTAVPMVGPVRLDGALVDSTDTVQVDVGPQLEVSVDVSSNGESATFAVELARLEVAFGQWATVPVWTVVTDEPVASFDRDLFEADAVYVITARARRGFAPLASGDLATVPATSELSFYPSAPFQVTLIGS